MPREKFAFLLKRSRIALAALLVGGLLAPAQAQVASWLQGMLWQEHFLWDALMTARDKAARQTADPNLLNVARTIAQQAAQQAANLQQIESYAKAQQGNLRFAFSQQDPSGSMATIRSNLDTLAKGTAQVRNNLYYLTARCRMASSQALPDPQLTQISSALIGQVQAAQLQLNSLYADAVAVQAQISAEAWLRDKTLRYNSDLLVRSALGAQDAIFAMYNSSYELYMRSK